jgi:hypothetical protein
MLWAVYDVGSLHNQLGSPLLEVGEPKMKMVEGRLPSTAFVPLVGFELELLSNPGHQQRCSSPKSCRGSVLEWVAGREG